MVNLYDRRGFSFDSNFPLVSSHAVLGHRSQMSALITSKGLKASKEFHSSRFLYNIRISGTEG